jgi:Integrase zinc binding domain
MLETGIRMASVGHERQRQVWNPTRNLGHKGIYATQRTIIDRFWWPSVDEDVSWSVVYTPPPILEILVGFWNSGWIPGGFQLDSRIPGRIQVDSGGVQFLD